MQADMKNRFVINFRCIPARSLQQVYLFSYYIYSLSKRLRDQVKDGFSWVAKVIRLTSRGTCLYAFSKKRKEAIMQRGQLPHILIIFFYVVIF
jgi:hypothetical protein